MNYKRDSFKSHSASTKAVCPTFRPTHKTVLKPNRVLKGNAHGGHLYTYMYIAFYTIQVNTINGNVAFVHLPYT